jgi:hypothetical protein
MRAIITAVAALSLAACGDSGQDQAPAQKIKVRGPEQDRMHQLDAFNLAIALKHAIYDAGYACKRVTGGGFVATYENLDMWMATCTDDRGLTRDWAVFTGPDGSAQVRDCKDVPGSGLPVCEVKKKPKGSFSDFKAAS